MENYEESLKISSGDKRCHPAQIKFIAQVRYDIDNGKTGVLRDWTEIRPPATYSRNNGCNKVAAESFYVQNIACWVPEVLNLPVFCPKCKRCLHVDDLRTSRWTHFPLTLLRLGRSGYIDCKRYNCRKCQNSFTGLNRYSLKLGGDQIAGRFRFYRTAGNYVLDEQLHAYIVSSSSKSSTKEICAQVHKMAYRVFVNDYIQFMALQGQGKVAPSSGAQTTRGKNGRKVLAAMRTQESMDNFILDEQPARRNGRCADLQSKRSQKKTELQRAALKAMSADNAARARIDLTSVASIGPGKARSLRSCGIKDATELVELYEAYQRSPNNEKPDKLALFFESRQSKAKRLATDGMLNNWVSSIKSMFNDRTKEKEERNARVRALEAEIEEMDTSLTRRREEAEPAEELLVAATADGSHANQVRFQQFSAFQEKVGYNAKVISEYMAENVLHSHFEERKKLLQARMTELSGGILSLDFCYKPAKKITVYTRNNGQFKPFKTMATICNEHGMVIWWGMLRNDESISELKPHLVNLKERLRRLNSTVKVIYVDNCCNVRNMLKEVFPDAAIKLDPFHWLKRWNDILKDSKSMEASIFRAHMSRAILVCPEEEFEATRERLHQKLQRVPTVAEVLRASEQTVAPPVERMLQNVNTVLRATMELDNQKLQFIASIPADDKTTERPSLTFKELSKVPHFAAKQLRHVRCNCLSDEPDVPIHFRQEGNNKVFCARGTNKNERVNETVESNLGWTAARVGLKRAERTIYYCFDEHNRRANERRLGAQNQSDVSELESMALGNSLAKLCGASDEELLFPDISMPAPESEELGKIGFDLYSEQLEAEEEEAEDTADGEQGEGQDENGEEGGQGEEGQNINDAFEEEICHDLEATLGSRVMAADRENARLISTRESTLQAFMRISGSQPWIPFADQNKDDPTAVEERKIFDSLVTKYNRNARDKNGPQGFKRFENEWNRIAGKRFVDKMNGVDGVIVIYRKSVQQLEEYYDLTRQQEAQSALATPTGDAIRHEMHTQLRDSRLATALPPVGPAVPLVYPPGNYLQIPLGAPAALYPFSISRQPSIGNRAPYGVAAIAAAPPVPEKRPDGRRLCSFCGREKKMHQNEPGTTRKLYGKTCNFEHCGRCGLRQKFHLGGLMGFECKNPQA